MESLPAALDESDFIALNICRTSAGWQASLEVSNGSFRVRIGRTPSEALRELFAPTPTPTPPSVLPPLPY